MIADRAYSFEARRLPRGRRRSASEEATEHRTGSRSRPFTNSENVSSARTRGSSHTQSANRTRSRKGDVARTKGSMIGYRPDNRAACDPEDDDARVAQHSALAHADDGHHPVVAVLRDAGEGGHQRILTSFCKLRSPAGGG